MVKIRPTTEQDRQGGKATVRRMMPMAGGVSAFEKVTRVNASALSRYGAPDEVDYHIPYDVALDLSKDTGNPALLIHFADQLGYDVLPRNERKKAGSLPDIKDFVHLSASVSALAVEYSDACDDDNITPLETQRILTRFDEGLTELLNVRRKFVAGTAQGGDA